MNNSERKHIDNDPEGALKNTETIINLARQICPIKEVCDYLIHAEEILDYMHKRKKVVDK